jgi:hypothetical protein
MPAELYMRSVLFFVFFYLAALMPTFSQKVIEGTSGNYSFSITKEVKPPILSIVEGSLRFLEPSGNDIIDAGESCRILFTLENNGLGDGINLTLKVMASGNTQGITFSPSRSLDVLKVGKKMDVEIPLSTSINTVDGSVTFAIKVDEPNGFGSDENTIEVKTHKFISPMVEVVDYTVTGGKNGSLVKKSSFDLQALVQNTQYGKAENVSVNLILPENVYMISGNPALSITELKPGETKSIVYSLIVSDFYTGQSIPITLRLSEKYGNFSKDKTFILTLNQAVASSKIVVEGDQSKLNTPPIEIASLITPVDKNIPVSGISHPERFALIIGNEDYSSRQPDLSKEVNVDFAENDARVFRDYVVKTLGVPERQAHLLINATTAEIKRELTWISNLAKLENGNAELIFYYSGHGLPDETTHEPYIIPVDVSGKNLRDGIKISQIYSRLTENPSRKVTVFLDACFSGGARNQGLLALKSVKIKPSEEPLQGNIVVFCSSSGDESSGVDREKQHGYFTWFLLQKLQQTKGEITYKEMNDYLIKNVTRETTLQNKPQTPQVMVSPDVQSTWEAWNFK